MKASPQIQAEVLRLFFTEHWKKGTIARELGLHHSTVTRIITRHVAPPVVRTRRSKVDPYLPIVQQTLAKYPKLNATRIFQMVKERGYDGGVDHFRDIVRTLRPSPAAEAFLRIETLPGEEAQVDWGSFGKLRVGAAEHRLLAFVMVLSYSRRIFLRFYLGDHTANFLRGHVAAFAHFEHVPRQILYDNLKTAVIERVDNAIHFNSDLLDLAKHYRFAPRPVPVARPTSKGKVERAIQYVRTSFFAARGYDNLEHLNEQALAWCITEAAERKWPVDKSITVSEAFQREKKSLLPLPENEFPAMDRKLVSVGKVPYVRFEGNDYSIPHTHVRQTLLVQATLETVRIVDGINIVAEHERSFDKGQRIECERHLDALVKEKRNPEASRHRGMNRLTNVVPSIKQFFESAARRGHNMGRLTQMLISMLELYGAADLEVAVADCLASGSTSHEAVRSRLETRRLSQGKDLPVPLRFLKDRRIQDVSVAPNSLSSYDRFLQKEDEE